MMTKTRFVKFKDTRGDIHTARLLEMTETHFRTDRPVGVGDCIITWHRIWRPKSALRRFPTGEFISLKK